MPVVLLATAAPASCHGIYIIDCSFRCKLPCFTLQEFIPVAYNILVERLKDSLLAAAGATE